MFFVPWFLLNNLFYFTPYYLFINSFLLFNSNNKKGGQKDQILPQPVVALVQFSVLQSEAIAAHFFPIQSSEIVFVHGNHILPPQIHNANTNLIFIICTPHPTRLGTYQLIFHFS